VYANSTVPAIRTAHQPCSATAETIPASFPGNAAPQMTHWHG
jgi:hypothetical protein